MATKHFACLPGRVYQKGFLFRADLRKSRRSPACTARSVELGVGDLFLGNNYILGDDDFYTDERVDHHPHDFISLKTGIPC